MNTYTCKYHPEREAVTKCEECGAMICLECKSIYRRHYHSSRHHYSYSTRYELCPVCYERKINQAYNPLCLIVPVIFIVIFMGMATSMFSGMGNFMPAFFPIFFFLVPILMICVLGYQYLIKGPQEKQKAKEKKERILQGKTPQSYKATYSPKKSTVRYSSLAKTYYCSQCGQLLSPEDQFCSNCGKNTTTHEK